ncbi:MAG: methionine biosynthesis protein MetW [Arenicellaceae bacterium]|nr:methionine biosynthesis protein MetW [Arenicellaceae bacterium]
MDQKIKRPDFDIITKWIEPSTRVLDLGCEDGELLKRLGDKFVSGYGVEINPEAIPLCVKNRVNVIQLNLDQGLAGFDDNSFDFVVLSLTLQAMKQPRQLLKEMLRVGQTGIVSFPNFGHWKVRTQLGFSGRMPVSRHLPNSWFNTPNIHMCTLKDFEILCTEEDIRILDRRAVNYRHETSIGLKLFPNLLGEIALYMFTSA